MILAVGDREDEVLGRPSRGGDGKEGLHGVGWKRGEPRSEQLLEVLRHGESLAGVRTSTLPLQRTGDLQGVERIPTGDLVETRHERTWQGRTEMFPEQRPEFPGRHRPHDHVAHPHPVESL